MPCYYPLDAYMIRGHNGSKAKIFLSVRELKWPIHMYDRIQLPCGRCIGCRLERSRQWAARLVCEQSMHSCASFITCTYSSPPLVLGPDGVERPSLCKRDGQLFLKRLRKHYSDINIRYYWAGEYGEQTFRPHYHACIFGLDFSEDRVLFSSSGPNSLYVSDTLTNIWGLGHCLIGECTFESAAYVARYCVKKVNGDLAESHYMGRVPEYAVMSRRPGIGGLWIEKYFSDCYPTDELVSRGRPSKPPRFFDNFLLDKDPELFAKVKAAREIEVGRLPDLRLAALDELAKLKLEQRKAVKEHGYG